MSAQLWDDPHSVWRLVGLRPVALSWNERSLRHPDRWQANAWQFVINSGATEEMAPDLPLLTEAGRTLVVHHPRLRVGSRSLAVGSITGEEISTVRRAALIAATANPLYLHLRRVGENRAGTFTPAIGPGDSVHALLFAQPLRFRDPVTSAWSEFTWMRCDPAPMASGGTEHAAYLSSGIRIAPHHPRFGGAMVPLDHAFLFPIAAEAAGRNSIDPTPVLSPRHDPLLTDLQPPGPPRGNNAVSDGWNSLSLLCPPADRWATEPLIPVSACASVLVRQWNPFITYVTGKRVSEFIHAIAPADEEEDQPRTRRRAASEDVESGPPSCYSGPYHRLSFVGRRFLFEIRRERGTAWLIDFPDYGIALRIYRERQHAMAYAQGVRTGLPRPFHRGYHWYDWQANAEAAMMDELGPII